MKLPKKIQICGKIYAVCEEKEQSCFGRANSGSKIITVGTKYGLSQQIWENILHEVAEMVCCERQYRYAANDDNSGIVFVMNHNEFDNFAMDLAAAIFPFLEKK